MENITILKLEPKHINGAAKLIDPLYKLMVKERKDIFIQKEEDWEDYLSKRLEDDDWILLIALVEEEIAGVCTAEIKHCGDNIETRIRDILFIDYIAVDKQYRRNGVGTRLLNEIKCFAKIRNIQTVELNVWGFNESAIKFYEKNKMKPKRIIYEYLIDKEK